MKTTKKRAMALVMALVLLVWSGVARGGDIHDSAAAGDVDKIKTLLAKNPDLVNARDDKRGNTPLHCAAIWGKTGALKVLLANKADVNAKDNEYGNTPLHWAASIGSKNMVALLLANNADVNAMANGGGTPLSMAEKNGRNDIAEILRQHGGLNVSAENKVTENVPGPPAPPVPAQGIQIEKQTEPLNAHKDASSVNLGDAAQTIEKMKGAKNWQEMGPLDVSEQKTYPGKIYFEEDGTIYSLDTKTMNKSNIFPERYSGRLGPKLSVDGKRLFFSDWRNGNLLMFDLFTKQTRILNTNFKKRIVLNVEVDYLLVRHDMEDFERYTLDGRLVGSTAPPPEFANPPSSNMRIVKVLLDDGKTILSEKGNLLLKKKDAAAGKILTEYHGYRDSGLYKNGGYHIMDVSLDKKYLLCFLVVFSLSEKHPIFQTRLEKCYIQVIKTNDGQIIFTHPVKGWVDAIW